MSLFDWIKRYIPQEKGYRKTGAGIVFNGTDEQYDVMMHRGVNAKSVFGLPGFKRGVDLISSKVSGCQAAVYKRKSGNGRDLYSDHAAYKLVRTQANVYSHPRDVFRQLISEALWNGNGYAWVQKEGSVPLAIWNLDPGCMTPIVIHTGTRQELVYAYRPNGQSEAIPLNHSEVIHVKGLSVSCGLVGMRLIDYASTVLQLGLDVQQYASVFFATGGAADSIIEFPLGCEPDEEKAKQYLELLKRRTRGVEQSRAPLLLTGGAVLKKTYLSNADSMMIESRGVTLNDVANLLNLPVSKLNGVGSYNYGSLESENVSILGETYDPWIFALENQLERTLLREDERDDVYIELDRNDLTRGDPSAQAAMDVQLLTNSLKSWQEIRASRNLPTVVDEDQIFFTQANLLRWNPNDPREEPQEQPPEIAPNDVQPVEEPQDDQPIEPPVTVNQDNTEAANG